MVPAFSIWGSAGAGAGRGKKSLFPELNLAVFKSGTELPPGSEGLAGGNKYY